jgi:hypothetical protein
MLFSVPMKGGVGLQVRSPMRGLDMTPQHLTTVACWPLVHSDAKSGQLCYKLNPQFRWLILPESLIVEIFWQLLHLGDYPLCPSSHFLVSPASYLPASPFPSNATSKPTENKDESWDTQNRNFTQVREVRYSENHTKPTDTFCGYNTEILLMFT